MKNKEKYISLNHINRSRISG